jgi:hypothetical protein
VCVTTTAHTLLLTFVVVVVTVVLVFALFLLRISSPSSMIVLANETVFDAVFDEGRSDDFQAVKSVTIR